MLFKKSLSKTFSLPPASILILSLIIAGIIFSISLFSFPQNTSACFEWETPFTIEPNPYPPGSALHGAWRSIYGENRIVSAPFNVAVIRDNDGGGCGGITPPACEINAGQPCNSSANSCGQTNQGVFDCNGLCSATAPAESSCVVNIGASLSANPTGILLGNSSTLTWSSSNADSCVGSGFPTQGATSGSVVVSPQATTEYAVTCQSSSGGSASGSWELEEWWSGGTQTLVHSEWVQNNGNLGSICQNYASVWNERIQYTNLAGDAGTPLALVQCWEVSGAEGTISKPTEFRGSLISGFEHTYQEIWYRRSAPGGSTPTSNPQVARATVSVTAQPNLTSAGTTNSSYNPAGWTWLVAGTGSTFSGTVSNPGVATATNFPNIFQVADQALSTTLAMLPAQNQTLSVGQSAAISAPHTFPSHGYYNVRSCADFNTSWAGSVAELNEADNCGAWTPFTVVPGAPTNLAHSCNAQGTQSTLSWGTPSGGSSGYYVRVALPSGQTTCPSGWEFRDWGMPLCVPNGDHVAGNSVVWPLTPNQGYSWWVHGKNTGGEWGPAPSGIVTCIPNQCADGIDNDGDGRIDGADFGCPGGNDETGDPAVSCSVSPASLNIGQSATYTANATNGAGAPFTWTPSGTPAAQSCTGGTGSTNTCTFNTPGTYAMTVRASGGGTPQANCSPNVSVTDPCPATTAPTITANGSGNPIRVNQGQAATISWNATNAGSCTITGPGINQSSTCTTPAGSATPTIQTQSIYTISCTSGSDTVIVNTVPREEEF